MNGISRDAWVSPQPGFKFQGIQNILLFSCPYKCYKLKNSQERVIRLMKIMSVFLMMQILSYGQISIEVKVVDEQGDSIEGAEVRVSYVNILDEESIILKSDSDGKIKSAGVAELRVNLSVTKNGFYETSFRKSEGTALRNDRNHDLIVILREGKNPIPLYAKKVVTKIPRIGEKCGFDFEIGDWTAPYGIGENEDLQLSVSEVVKDTGELGGKLRVTFPNEGEGIYRVTGKKLFLKNSKMKLPHLAKKFDYLNSLERKEYGIHNKEVDWNCGYFLRTRKKERGDGSFEYRYAKLSSDVNFYMSGGKYIRKEWRSKSPVEYAHIEFTYYHNPTANDRNLEFDPERNLFDNLSRAEKVSCP